MTFNKKAFRRLWEKNTSIQVELGEDATYPITRIGFVSFRRPAGDVLELDDVPLVSGLTKNLLSIQP